MNQSVKAIYENGVLRPLKPLQGISEHAQVHLTIQTKNGAGNLLSDCIGIMPNENAQEMRTIIEEEFEKVDLSDW